MSTPPDTWYISDILPIYPNIFLLDYNKVELRFVSYNPLYACSLWIDVCKVSIIYCTHVSHKLFDQLTYPNSQKAYIKFHLRKYYNHSLPKHTSLESPKETHYFKFHEISWCWEYLLLLASINSDIIHKEYMTALGSHPYKATINFDTSSGFS